MEPVLGKTASARIALRCNVSIMVMQVEEVFGWMKTVGMLRKTRHRGVFKVGWVFTFAGHCLQPRAHAGSAVGSSIRMSQGRSVPGTLKNRDLGHVFPYGPL